MRIRAARSEDTAAIDRVVRRSYALYVPRTGRRPTPMEAMTENLSVYPRLGYEEVDRRTEDGFERVYFAKTLS